MQTHTPKQLLNSLTEEQVSLSSIPLDRDDEGFQALSSIDLSESTHVGGGKHDPHVIPKTEFTRNLKSERGWTSSKSKNETSHDKDGNFEVFVAAGVGGSLDTGTDLFDLLLPSGTAGEVKEGQAQINNGARTGTLTRNSQHLSRLYHRYENYVHGWQQLCDLMAVEGPVPEKFRAAADMVEHGPHFDVENLTPETVQVMSAVERVLQEPEVANTAGIWAEQSELDYSSALDLLEAARKSEIRKSMRAWLEDAKSRVFTKMGGEVLFNVYEGEDHYRVYTITGLNEFNESYSVRRMCRGQVVVELNEESNQQVPGIMSKFDRVLYNTVQSRNTGSEFWIDVRSVENPPTVTSLPTRSDRNAGGIGYEVMEIVGRMVRVRLRCGEPILGDVEAEEAETLSLDSFREAYHVLRAPNSQWSTPSGETVAGYVGTISRLLSELESSGKATVLESENTPYRGAKSDVQMLAEFRGLDVEVEAPSGTDYDLHDRGSLGNLYQDAEVAEDVFRQSSRGSRGGLRTDEYVRQVSEIKRSLESRGFWNSHATTSSELSDMYGLEKNSTNRSGKLVEDLERAVGEKIVVEGGRGNDIVFSVAN